MPDGFGGRGERMMRTVDARSNDIAGYAAADTLRARGILRLAGSVVPIGEGRIVQDKKNKNTTTNHNIDVARYVNAAAVARDLVGLVVSIGGDASSRNLPLKQKEAHQDTGRCWRRRDPAINVRWKVEGGGGGETWTFMVAKGSRRDMMGRDNARDDSM
jgi:hypothetical protein